MASRVRWWMVGGVALGVLANAVVYRHAVAMTTFVDEGQRTPSPENLTRLGTARVLLTGVRIPRPVEDRDPGSVGLQFTDAMVLGPAGPLEVWVVPGGPQVVVLVHGYASHRGQLLPTARRLSDLGYTVVIPNLRGSGASGGHKTSLGWHEAEDVAAVALGVSDPRPILYGFSMGGVASLGAVARHGVDAEAVVVEATFDRLITTTGHRFAHMGLPRRGLSDWLLLWGGWTMGVWPYDVAPVDDARSVAVPTRVVAGTEDARVHPDEAAALARALPAGSLVVVDGLPHAPLATAAPERWSVAVGDWLQAVAPPSGTSQTGEALP